MQKRLGTVFIKKQNLSKNIMFVREQPLALCPSKNIKNKLNKRVEA